MKEVSEGQRRRAVIAAGVARRAEGHERAPTRDPPASERSIGLPPWRPPEPRAARPTPFAAKQAPVEWRVVNDSTSTPSCPGEMSRRRTSTLSTRWRACWRWRGSSPAGRGLHAAGGAALEARHDPAAVERVPGNQGGGEIREPRTNVPLPSVARRIDRSRGRSFARTPARRTIRPPRLSPKHPRSEHARDPRFPSPARTRRKSIQFQIAPPDNSCRPPRVSAPTD